jgi:glucose-1-phosphate thymidylyltransferase
MKKMKGVIAAGGIGSRLFPLTHVTNKHLLPVYDEPMVHYPIRTLVKAGITDILIITGGPHAGHFLRTLKNGHHLGVKHLEYAYQDNEGGIPRAISLAEEFADGDNIAVILGDNTTDANIKPVVDKFKAGGHLFLKKVPDPERYGIPVFTPDGKSIIKTVEKPKDPQSSKAITGLYLFDNTVFDIIRTLKPSKRGEFEVTDIHNVYLNRKQLTWSDLVGFWSDAGKFETLFLANQYWAQKKQK